MTLPPLAVVPNPIVAALRPYSPGRLDFAIDLVLDANESLASAPALVEALRFGSDASVHRYPAAADLEARLAAGLAVDPSRVLVTAGADDALERAIRSVGAPGRRAILTTPSFAMLPRYAHLTGADVVEIPWWRGPWPVDEVLGASGDDLAVVAVVSPNNPTGAVISWPDLERLATAMPKTLVLFDHAYAEFADDDLTARALTLPNVVVFRTFSKAWGAAGLRVGYAVGDERVIGWMRSVGQPYSVSAPSLAAVRRLLDSDPAPPVDRLDRILTERSTLTTVLEGLGLEVLPSQANFVLVRPADALALRRDLASLGIAVRAFAGHPRLEPWLRITLPGDDDAFRRLEAALRTALAPEAVLFDMDGVLADVSGSYRRAILDTAATWGVELASVDVVAAKAAGNANDDWQLTHRLMAERGVVAPLSEVIERFEGFYQGRDGRRGLRHHETARFDRKVLEELAARRPLAVVTGRPRQDAQRFLDEHDLSALFTAVVCIEDAPSKPDPAPVRLALERLGVAHAWMVGDTPDDLRAARAAGVLPVGLPASGDDLGTARVMLTAAGAARILDHPDQLKEILP
jgi:histidinol-phosphate aminotransferase